MKFTVHVKRTDGTEETRHVEAESRFAVYAQIEKEGGMVMSLEEGGGGLAMPAWTQIKLSSGIKTEEKITFTKNLAAMLSAGLTLSRALSVIGNQTKNKYLKSIVASLELGVKSGQAFHETLAQYPDMFSPLFVAMTKAGEESGTLSDALKVVAKQMDRSYTLTKKVKGAMIYPSIIVAAIVVIAILMLIFVVPTLSSTFASLGSELPLATRVIIGMSQFVTHNVIVVILLMIGIVVGGTFFIRSKRGSALILTGSMYLPAIGDLVRETYGARAARTLSSLLTSGVEMLTAITIAGEVVGDNAFGKVLTEAEVRVRKGEALSAAFIDHPKLFPVFVVAMLTVGEETGKVADMLGQVAEYYENDVEDRTKDLSTIIEPVLMLFIGLFVGVFAMAMIAPIYSLSSKI
jgi:type IV pilus assembly protein PilC